MNKLLLVDLSAVFWRNWHATKDQEISEAFAQTISKIAYHRNNYDKTFVCCDLAPYKRKSISADYKAQRDTPDPVAVGQLKRVKERLLADGLPLAEAQGYEADDIIATVCSELSGDESPWEIDILTGDKDLMALVDERVSILTLTTGERISEDGVQSKMGVPPCRVTELLALTGDTADNVPGCPGVGPKTAAQLLKDNGGLDGIVNGVAESIVAKGKLLEALIANREQIKLSWELVRLMTDAPIDVTELFAKREVKPIIETKDEEFEVTETEPEKPALVEPKQTTELQAIELAKAQPVKLATFENSLEPQSMGQAWALAKSIFASRLFQVESPESALMILMTGREMNIGAMASMRGFHFIKGKPCMSAQLMSALILKSGKAEYWELVESSNKTATYATKRVNGRNEQRKTFTVDDAKLAQLIKQDGNWVKYPASMCEARAASALARIVYPDLLAGVYTPEELE